MSDFNIIKRDTIHETLEANGIETIGEAAPGYAVITGALSRMGWRIRAMYVESQATNQAIQLGAPDMVSILQHIGPATTIWWENDGGSRLIQCGNANGESELFAPIATPDISSQLAELNWRFANKPAIAG